jgi:hypothetical protein
VAEPNFEKRESSRVIKVGPKYLRYDKVQYHLIFVKFNKISSRTSTTGKLITHAETCAQACNASRRATRREQRSKQHAEAHVEALKLCAEDNVDLLVWLLITIWLHHEYVNRFIM